MDRLSRLLILGLASVAIMAFAGEPNQEEIDALMESQNPSSLAPKDGFVPDEKTAVRIAEAVARPIFGAEVDKEKPFKAHLRKGVWLVDGFRENPCKGKKDCYAVDNSPIHVELSKADGKVVKIYKLK